MNPNAIRVLLACTLVSCAQRQDDDTTRAIPARTCGIDSTAELTSEGIGAFRIGATVEQLRAGCTVIRDTSLALGTEGMPERRLTVLLDQDSVTATVQGDSVWRIEVRTPRIRTADSLGVGSTVATLRRQPTTFLGYGEGGPYVRVDRHCGLSFELTGVGQTVQRFEQVPATATVERVLVVGCSPRQ